MTSINLSNNNIVAKTKMVMPKPGMALGDLIDGNPIIYIWSNGTDVDVMIYDGIRAIANAIPDMGALSVLSLAKNCLYAEGGKVLAAGLKGNQGITTLDISSNKLGWNRSQNPDMSGVIALADAIPDMGALSVLSLKDNKFATKEGGKALAHALASSSTLTELDVSCNNLKDRYGDRRHQQGDGPVFAQELAIGISNNVTLTSVNISNNNFTNYGIDMSGNAYQI
jgi:hypothetical protein